MQPWRTGDPIRIIILCVLILVLLSPFRVAGQKTKQTGRCFNIGDTVTLRGKIDGWTNGGTYFLLLEKICVHYPRQTDRFTPTNLDTIGDKLPPNIYLEVTGELRDPWPLMGIGIKVTSYTNVAKEVEAERAEWKRRCEQWQAQNIPDLSTRTHGGTIGRITDDEPPERNCSIYAADMKLPHEAITIRRPEPKP